MRYVSRRLSFAAAAAIFLAGVFASSTAAQDRELPWASGQSVVSGFEAQAAQVVNGIAQRTDLQVICNGNTDWGVLAVQGGFDANLVWGYVMSRFNTQTRRWEPLPYTHVSEAACLYADRFWAASDKTSTKNCQISSTPVYENRTVTRVKYQWKTVKKRVGKKVKTVRIKQRTVATSTVQVKVGDEPVYSVCRDWSETLFALQTFPHESMHLRGITSESLAECYGMQLLAHTAIQFGATPEFAREIAKDYAATWYVPARGIYWRADCVDGGPLDLNPSSSSWPAGF
jgi:hypothetical protein